MPSVCKPQNSNVGKQILTFLFLLVFTSVRAQLFSVMFPDSLEKKPLNGRLLLILSNNDKAEPRFQVGGGPSTQLIFGVDVNDWKPGTTRAISTNADGYPKERLEDVPAGNYFVQVVFHVYETFHRKDGYTLRLPMDRGEGQHWNSAPGNLFSVPVKIAFNPRTKNINLLALTRMIPPLEEPKDSKYVKHIRIQSKLLSEFWGRPIFLGAHVLLPEGWDTHPDVKYPLAIFHGHYPADFSNWRTVPPDESLVPDSSERFRITGYNKITQQEDYNFYKRWTGPGFPRVIAIEIQHANQFYDDSYAVNSANIGPYGDAITYELIPEIEKRFRGIGKGWARFLYGGSTGGWESLAVQVFYPDEYNGCYAACPDPIDFTSYTVVNIYKDTNAYFLESRFSQTPRAGMRDWLGRPTNTMKGLNQLELAFGDSSRSGEQWDIWEAVFSPVGKNGYPARIWNKRTGTIDQGVANYWKEHFDLTHIIQRDWPVLGEKLKGKIHIYVGEMDNYFLDNAVYSAEDALKKLQHPACQCEFDYGSRAEHCWNGDHTQPNYISRLRYHLMFINKWAEEVKSRAPADADLSSWRY
jgi:enterochelin esterase-like enzyme